MEQDKKKISLAILIGALVFYLDFAYVIKQQIMNLGQLNKKIVSLNKNFSDYNLKLKKMQELKGGQGAVAAQEPGGKRMLKEDQLPIFLQDIENIAKESQVVISSIRPQRQEQPKLSQATGAGKLALLQVSLELVCTYHQFGKFINALENKDTYVDVGSLKISAKHPDYLRQNVSLLLRTYVE